MKLTRRTVLLAILLLLLVYLAIGFIKFSRDTTEFKKEYEEEHSALNGNESISDPYAVKAPEREVLDEVPDYIANRGVVLRGRINDDDPGNVYRESATGVQSMWGPVWWGDYICDCNLSVETDSHDLMKFCRAFYEGGEDPFKYNFRGEELFSTYIFDNGHNFSIFRTCLVNDDFRGGAVFIQDDPGVYEPVFYEPGGRFVMQEAAGSVSCDEEYLIEFLEPEMVLLKVTVTGSDPREELTITQAEKIQEYLDAMHELEFTLVDENPVAVLDSSRVVQLSFTAENEECHDYYFTAEGYMVNDDNVYRMEQTDIVFPIPPKPVTDEYYVEDDMVYINGF